MSLKNENKTMDVKQKNHSPIVNRDYVLIYMPEHPNSHHGRVAEHRLVMEKRLGRMLSPKEVVHHKDGNTQNNAIENLELFASKGKHAHYHAILRGQKSIKPNDYVYTDEHRKNISKSHMGVKFSEERRMNISKAHMGIRCSDAAKEKLRKASTGRKHTAEAKIKMSKAMKGRKFTEEHMKNWIKSHTGKKCSDETKEKLRKSSTGRRHTAEAKEKIRKAATLWWYRKKHKILYTEDNIQPVGESRK